MKTPIRNGLSIAGTSLSSLIGLAPVEGTGGNAAVVRAVEQFAQSLPGYDQPGELLDGVAQFLTHDLRVGRHSLFIVDEVLPRLVRVRCHPAQDSLPDGGLALDCPLVRFFQTAFASCLDVNSEGGDARATSPRAAAQEQLRQMEFTLALPLVSRERLIGLLAVGPKPADGRYGSSDRIGFALLARDVALTLDRLMDEDGLDLIGRVSRGLAHDIRDLLTPVSTCIQLGAAGDSSWEMARDLQPLAMQSLELLKARVQHARQLAAAGSLQLEVCRLDELVRAAADSVNHELARNELTLSFGALPEIEAAADPVVFQRLLTNLLANAINASSRGSQIRIELSAPSGQAADGQWARLAIIDHGAGMSPEQLRRILAPALASAGDGSESGRREGSGLAICRQIVALHGGRMGVQSQVGQGTTVTVCLPLQTTPPTESPKSSSSSG